MSTPRRVVVAITGASGAVYGVRALELLRDVGAIETHLVLSNPAKTTIGVETDVSVGEVEELADHVHGSRDIGAPIASGSFRTEGMIVAPCSIKTLSAVATSFSSDLVARAADVTLKERRPLVLMVRETPFHLGHLRLMERVTEAGAIVYPPVPAFYNKPTSLADVVTHSVGRALEHLGVTVDGLSRWGESD
ncbi:MAG: UbiX family flavin prenyltransferase [Actinomycetota bacterium]